MASTTALVRLVRLACWSGFAASLAFGTALAIIYGHPCPGARASFPQNFLVVCGPRAIAPIGNANTIFGLVCLLAALVLPGVLKRRRAKHTPAKPEEPIVVHLRETSED